MNSNQIFFQDQTGVEGTSESGDLFSDSLAAGNFDGNGQDDLAIGVPGDDIKNITDAGAANVLNGSDIGLTATNSQIWFQDQPGVEATGEAGDSFAKSLATGNFDGDADDDLAVGVPFENIKGTDSAGAVNILNGSDRGLTSEKSQIWFQDQPGVEGTSEPFNNFGSSLAAGDFNGDNFDDLAVGVPFENIKGIGGAGAVNVLNGSDVGLTAENSQIWFQDQPGVEGTAEALDAFGSSLAAGDFNGDGFDDLAVGIVNDDIKGVQDAGAVNVFGGSANGLTANKNQIWFQDQPGVEGTSEEFDGFGSALTAGDFNGDGFDDLAVGVSQDDIKGIQDAGAVNVFGGSANGLTANKNQIWFQDQPGVEGTSEKFDGFGRESLSTGDFNGDGFDDLAVGVIKDDIKGIQNAGAVNIFNGSTVGLTSDKNQIWFQDQPGIEGTSESGDLFGSGLSVGDFNGDGFDDLTIGVSNEDIGSVSNAGASNTLFGSTSGLTA